MKPVLIAAAVLMISALEVNAQIRRPAPTGQIAPAGQVPTASTGQGSAARPYSQYQPKPTGQIAPVTTAQPATGTVTNVNGTPVTATQSANQAGQIPKVNTNQDQATFPERYVPNQTTTQTERVITIEDVQKSLPVQQTQPATTYPATQPDANGNVTAQPATTTGQTQTSSTQPQPATTTTTTQTSGQSRTTTQPRSNATPQVNPAASTPRAQP